jgi:hypothetical protein
MRAAFTESIAESAALGWLKGAGRRPDVFRSADPCACTQPTHNLAISRPRKPALGRSSAIPPLGR